LEVLPSATRCPLIETRRIFRAHLKESNVLGDCWHWHVSSFCTAAYDLHMN